MEQSSFTGLVLPSGESLPGLLMEGGKLSQILQSRRRSLSLVGCLGVVMLQFPLAVFVAVRRLANIFFERKLKPHEVVRELVNFANKARKGGSSRST